LCSLAREAGWERLAAEDAMSHRRFDDLAERCGAELVAATSWVEEIRQVKEPDEIGRVEAAQRLTDETFDHILSVIRSGITEREIGLEIEFFMRRNGSEGVAFPPIVASGPNSALPHAKVTERVLVAGDFVKLDFGARVGGYCADMTRTVVVGQADQWQREVYEAVLDANLAGIAAVAPGLLGSEIDEVSRNVLAERGMARLFGHGLGHGVGLQVHELPGVGPRGSKPVPEGSVITIEPGVYEPGRGGVRIEDLVVVESTGARVLTRSTKDLIEL
jgi:Xaa-Pro aminopeptidase